MVCKGRKDRRYWLGEENRFPPHLPVRCLHLLQPENAGTLGTEEQIVERVVNQYRSINEGGTLEQWLFS